MQNDFDLRLRNAHGFARAADTALRDLREYADADPRRAAHEALVYIPNQLRAWRGYVNRAFGVNLDDRETWSKFQPKAAVDAVAFVLITNDYDLYRRSWLRIEHLMKCALTHEEFHRAVCDTHLELLREKPGTAAHSIATLVQRRRDIFRSEGLGEFLAGHLATHISLSRAKRLRAAIDEIRPHSIEKPAIREQFEVLLRELFVEAPLVWGEKPVYSGDLLDIRTKVAGKLAMRPSKASEEEELWRWVDREQFLSLVRDIGLPPRELELFKLHKVDGLTLRESAKRMGVAEGTAKSLWSRIKNTRAVS